MSDDERRELAASVSAGSDRLADAVRALIADGGNARRLQPDWADQVGEALTVLGQIIDLDHHPDDTLRARQVISQLAAMWLSPAEHEAVYLGVDPGALVVLSVGPAGGA